MRGFKVQVIKHANPTGHIPCWMIEIKNPERKSYLHKDLTIHVWAYSSLEKKYPGFYMTRKEARETIKAWYFKVTKPESY